MSAAPRKPTISKIQRGETVAYGNTLYNQSARKQELFDPGAKKKPLEDSSDINGYKARGYTEQEARLWQGENQDRIKAEKAEEKRREEAAAAPLDDYQDAIRVPTPGNDSFAHRALGLGQPSLTPGGKRRKTRRKRCKSRRKSQRVFNKYKGRPSPY